MAGEFDVEREMHRIAFRLVGGPHHGSVLLADLEASLLGVHRRARAAAFDKAAQLADTRAEMATDPRVYAVCMHLSARLRALAAREKEGT